MKRQKHSVACAFALLTAVGAATQILSIPTLASDPVLVGTWPGAKGGVGAGIFVTNNLAFVGSGEEGDFYTQPLLVILDVTNPATPVQVWKYKLGVADVVVSGQHAYVSAYWGPYSYAVVDIGNPSSPIVVGSYTCGPGNPCASALGNMAVSDKYAYVTGDRGLVVFDVSNPANPVRVANYDSGVSQGGRGVSVRDRYAYLATTPSQEEHRLVILDVADPTQPVLIGSADGVGGALNITVSGGYAYVAAGNGFLQIHNVQLPTNPFYVGGGRLPGLPNGFYGQGVAVSGHYAYVAAGAAGLQVIDVSDPVNPVRAGSYSSSVDAQDVVVSGNYAYLADGHLGLLVLAIGEPPTIRIQPQGQTVLPGSSVILSVTAEGRSPLSYQWQKDGVNIPGATDASLSFSNAQLSDSGHYVAIVTNLLGRATSAAAVLWVIEPPDYRLRVLPSRGGIVLSDPFLETHAKNSAVQISVICAGGWTFLDWLGDASGTSPELTLTMNSDKCIQARFGTSLSVSNPLHGTIEVIPSEPLYPSGTVVQLEARPETGYYFANWTGTLGGSANPVPYTVQTAFQTVGAEFLPLPEGKVALVLLSEGEGQVVADPRVNVCAEGTAVTLTARPKPDQEFLGWSGDASGNTSPLTLAMDKSKVVVANFSKRPRLEAWTCPTPLHDGGALLLLTGEWGATYEIQVSGDLHEWNHLMTLTNLLGSCQFRDPSAALETERFYRAMAQP